LSGRPARPELTALRLADAPERWARLGFAVAATALTLGEIRIELGQAGEGIVGWRLRDVDHATSTIDGLPTAVADSPATNAGPSHPNGAVGVDHVVVTTPDFDRTASALAAAGMPLRRVRETPGGFRQGFRRIGPAILELVEARGVAPGPARFWGLVVIVSDLQALAERLADHLGPTRAAVQPGRQIATLRESAGLGEAVAFMSPDPS
jgi:hypothetical protein